MITLRRWHLGYAVVLLGCVAAGCFKESTPNPVEVPGGAPETHAEPVVRTPTPGLLDSPIALEPTFGERIALAAEAQILTTVTYDASYVSLGYPNGDVPADRGVCADVVVRALRAVGNDLQVLVHEDMQSDFGAYPKKWGLLRTDTNIDHRRVPNLCCFFTRRNFNLAVTDDDGDYLPGDIVSWNLSDGMPHIGIVSTKMVVQNGRRYVVHNIGAGPQLEDVLFSWDITGHYRFEADEAVQNDAREPAQ